jgi:hypothetical protein
MLGCSYRVIQGCKKCNIGIARVLRGHYSELSACYQRGYEVYLCGRQVLDLEHGEEAAEEGPTVDGEYLRRWLREERCVIRVC